MSKSLYCTVYPTLYRDYSALFLRRRFWGLLALWGALCALLFFTYLEDFLSIQPVLRAKNFRYGVTDIVIIPYLQSTGYFALIVVTALCARLGYQEHFSPFSRLYRSIATKPSHFIVAKLIYINGIIFFILGFLLLPVLVSGCFFHYDITRVFWLFLGQFLMLLSVGLLALVFSQIVAHSVVVVLATLLLVALTELAAALVTEPTWWANIVSYFSPIAHLERIATGVVTFSDLAFFTTLLFLLILISVRQWNNTYFFTR